MDFSFDLLGIQASFKVEQHIVDNINRIGDLLLTSLDKAFKEQDVPVYRKWSSNETGKLLEELGKNKNMEELCKILNRTHESIMLKLEEIIEDFLEDHTVKQLKNFFNNNEIINPIIIRVLQKQEKS